MAVEIAAQQPEAGAAVKKSKKVKKESKKQKASEQEDVIMADAESEVLAAVADVEVEGEKKDKKKKKKKAAAAEESEEPAAEEQVESGEGEKKKKKKNKEKKEGEETSSTDTTQNGEDGEKKKKKKKQKVDTEEEVADVAEVTEEKKTKTSKKQKGKKDEESAEKGVKRKAAVEEEEEVKGTKKPKKAPAPAQSTGSYVESEEVAAMTEKEVAAYREKKGITVEGDQEYRPIRFFADAKCVPDNIMAVCGTFKEPTAIQAQAWPVCLSGRDMVGIAATGSGKTIAFAVPSAMYISDQPPLNPQKGKKGPHVLVLAPTRELAMQIEEVYKKMTGTCGIRSACIYGGVSKQQQSADLRQGLHVVVATPGRLLAHMDEGACNLSGVGFLVLDEADRMLDMGFEPDIRRIIGAIKGKRQTVMFSATWPKEIRTLASEFLSNPVKVTVGSQDLAANKAVTQVVEVIDPKDKDWRLTTLMQKYHNGKNRLLVFVLYKKEAPRVERFLRQKGYKVGAVHGDMNQFERTAAVEAFKSGQTPVLIATDVCARGLDIPAVEVVINYSFPLTVEDYVHRIGRTGRAGATGTAHTFFTVQDKTLAGPLSDVLKEAGAQVPDALLKFGYAPQKKKEHALYGNHFIPEDQMITKKATKITFDDDE